MAKPDWQNQNYKKTNPVQKAAAGTLALGGLLAYGAKKAYDAFKNRKKDSDTSATTGIDISKDIKARNKPMVTPQQRKENQKAIQDIVDSQEVKYIRPKKGLDVSDDIRKAQGKTERRIKTSRDRGDLRADLIKEEEKPIVIKKNQDSNNNNQDSEKLKKKKPTTTGTRSSNRSRILKDAASRTGKQNSEKKKPGMYENYPRDVEARLKKIDKEIAKLMPTIKSAAGSKKYKTLRAEKKDLLKNFKNKSIAETMTP